MKAEFLQLAQKYDPKKHHIYNWYLSEKLDGIRAFWDGGITIGLRASEIPWANVDKDHRLKEEVISTGLWSRYGHVLHAPRWWTDFLPRCPLDGELYAGLNSWQKLSSIVKRFDKSNNWDQVKFMILDSPPLMTIFENKNIDNINYKKLFRGIPDWIKEKFGSEMFIEPKPFFFIYERLKQANINNDIIQLLEQIQIPYGSKGKELIEESLRKVCDKGGEGLIFRDPGSRYRCERSWSVLKYKPFNDDEGVVTGYNWGKEGKLLGLMGSMIVSYKGNLFELSGFTDQEREMHFIKTNLNAKEEGTNLPGMNVSPMVTNKLFPRGSKITFRYRELSDQGLPKEARYLRPYIGA